MGRRRPPGHSEKELCRVDSAGLAKIRPEVTCRTSAAGASSPSAVPALGKPLSELRHVSHDAGRGVCCLRERSLFWKHLCEGPGDADRS